MKLLGSASKFTWEQLTGQAAPPNRAHLEHGPRVQRAPSAVARPAISASTLGAWEPSSSQIVGQNSSHSWQLAGLGSGTSSVPQKRKHAEHAKLLGQSQRITFDFADDFDETPRHAMHFSAQNIDSPSTRQSHSEEAVGPIKCPEGHCDWTGKVQSDLKKHLASHKLDQVCEMSECNRSFATVNDLSRHKMTVHKIYPKGTRIYRCFAPGCAKPEKEWPRKDNFRSHIKKAHPNEEVDEIVRRSEEWWDSRQHGSADEAEMSVSSGRTEGHQTMVPRGYSQNIDQRNNRQNVQGIKAVGYHVDGNVPPNLRKLGDSSGMSHRHSSLFTDARDDTLLAPDVSRANGNDRHIYHPYFFADRHELPWTPLVPAPGFQTIPTHRGLIASRNIFQHSTLQHRPASRSQTIADFREVAHDTAKEFSVDILGFIDQGKDLSQVGFSSNFDSSRINSDNPRIVIPSLDSKPTKKAFERSRMMSV